MTFFVLLLYKADKTLTMLEHFIRGNLTCENVTVSFLSLSNPTACCGVSLSFTPLNSVSRVVGIQLEPPGAWLSVTPSLSYWSSVAWDPWFPVWVPGQILLRTLKRPPEILFMAMRTGISNFKRSQGDPDVQLQWDPQLFPNFIWSKTPVKTLASRKNHNAQVAAQRSGVQDHYSWVMVPLLIGDNILKQRQLHSQKFLIWRQEVVVQMVVHALCP